MVFLCFDLGLRHGKDGQNRGELARREGRRRTELALDALLSAERSLLLSGSTHSLHTLSDLCFEEVGRGSGVDGKRRSDDEGVSFEKRGRWTGGRGTNGSVDGEELSHTPGKGREDKRVSAGKRDGKGGQSLRLKEEEGRRNVELNVPVDADSLSLVKVWLGVLVRDALGVTRADNPVGVKASNLALEGREGVRWVLTCRRCQRSWRALPRPSRSAGG